MGRSPGVSAERVAEIRAMEADGTLGAYCRATVRRTLLGGRGAPVAAIRAGLMEDVMTADDVKTLTWYFPTSHERTRRHLASVVACLREHGPIEDDRNATGLLTSHLRRRGLRELLTGTRLSTRLKDLADEGLLEREVDGRRTKRLALTDAGRAVDLEGYRLPPPNGKLKSDDPPGPSKRLEDLRDHFKRDHADLVPTLAKQPEWANPVALGRIDGGLHREAEIERARRPAPTPDGDGEIELATLRITKTSSGVRVTIDVHGDADG